MRSVAIVDTSIFCNILNIPNMNSDCKKVMKKLESLIENRTNLLLPMASIYETGNHIAQLKLSDGNVRRNLAESFKKHVEMAIKGEAPWTIMQFPNKDNLTGWLRGYPDAAMRGTGMGDISIINEWDELRKKTPNHRVFIWAIDTHLSGYDSHPHV